MSCNLPATLPPPLQIATIICYPLAKSHNTVITTEINPISQLIGKAVAKRPG